MATATATTATAHHQGRQQLITSAARGDVDGVRRLLDLAPPTLVEGRDDRGRTALVAAIDALVDGSAQDPSTQRTIIRLLLVAGANSGAMTTEGQTPWTLAASLGDEELVQVLLLDGQDESQSKALKALTREKESSTTSLQPGPRALAALEGDGERILAVAAGRDHVAVLRLLLPYVPNWHHRPSILCAACREGQLEAAELLLAEGANLRPPVRLGAPNALLLAYESGCKELVEFLLRSGADPNVDVRESAHRRAGGNGGVNSGDSPEPLLRVAVRRWREDRWFLELLLRHGANPNRTRWYYSPLSYAVEHAPLSVILALLHYGGDLYAAETSGSYRYPLQVLVGAGRHEIFDFLVASGRVHTLDPKLFVTACRSGSVELVEFLWAHYHRLWTSLDPTDIAQKLLRTRIGFTNATGLLCAIEEGHLEITRWLLAHGADTRDRTRDDSTTLLVAAQSGNVAVVECLLEAFGPTATPEMVNTPNSRGRRPLHAAAQHGSAPLVTLLLAHGAIVDVLDIQTESPLGLACWGGHVEIVDLLLRHGATIDATTVFPQRRPLTMASNSRNLEIVECLLEHGAAMTSTRADGMTDVHFLAFSIGAADMLRLYLAHGAEVDVPSANGETPLYSAVLHQHLEQVEVLVAHGANVHFLCGGRSLLSTVRGWRPHAQDRARIERILVDAGAIASWDSRRDRIVRTRTLLMHPTSLIS